MIESDTSPIAKHPELVDHSKGFEEETAQRLEAAQVDFAARSSQYTEVHDRVFPHLSFDPYNFETDQYSTVANTEFAKEKDPDASSLQSTLTELIEAKLELEKSQFKLMQAEGKYAESLDPTVQLQNATLERALAEIKGGRHKNTRTPNDLSNLEVVFNWFVDNEKGKIYRDERFYQNIYKLRTSEKVVDIFQDVIGSRNLGEVVNNYLLGRSGSGRRGLRSQSALHKLELFSERRRNNLESIKDQFYLNSEGWYMPVAETQALQSS